MDRINNEPAANYATATDDDILKSAERILFARLKRLGSIKDPTTATAFLRARLAHLPYERFDVMLLDSRYRIIGCEALFRGTVTNGAVHPREVARLAMAFNATAVIVAHNHPSGDSTPSQADIAITTRLRDALDLLDIRLLDHIVVGIENTTSLASRGLC